MYKREQRIRNRSFACLMLILLAIGIPACFLLPTPGSAQTIIKKNNPQSRVVYFLMIDSASSTSAGKTGLTGAAAGTAVTLTTGAAGSFSAIQFSTNGGTLVNCAGTITEIGKGYYAYVPTSGESNTTYDCLFVAQATGALDYAGQVAFSTYKVDDIGPQTDLIATNAGDSPAAKTAQTNAATAATQATSANTATGTLLTNQGTLATSISGIPAAIFGTTAATYNGAGTFGAKLNAAGSASDPLANPLSGYTIAGTGGYALNRLLGMTNGSSQFVAGAFTLLPNVTIGGYASGQDPATLLWTSTEGKKLLTVSYGSFSRNPVTGVTTYNLIGGGTLVLTPTADSQGRVTGRN